jgi:hypothetical protein
VYRYLAEHKPQLAVVSLPQCVYQQCPGGSALITRPIVAPNTSLLPVPSRPHPHPPVISHTHPSPPQDFFKTNRHNLWKYGKQYAGLDEAGFVSKLQSGNMSHEMRTLKFKENVETLRGSHGMQVRKEEGITNLY